jgi:hypothetical protein
MLLVKYWVKQLTRKMYLLFFIDRDHDRFFLK